MSRSGRNNDDGSFDWREAVFDALILSALTFFTALGGLGATGAIAAREILAAGIAAATQFFMTLALKRGLRKQEG